MTFKTKQLIIRIFLAGIFLISSPLFPQEQEKQLTPEEKLLAGLHSISSHDLYDFVAEQCKEKYGGRLTGTDGYNASAQWVVSLLKQWGVKPAGDNGTYFQDFKNPYTLVLESGHVTLHIPLKNKKNTFIDKHYRYETDYIPGSTSGSGEVKAEVIYVGYGITAPELGFDEYKGLDVKGKIVMIEREVPVSPSKSPDEFKKWRPYSFHQYKVKNAVEQGAAGMLYVYHIANPNCTYYKDFILSYVGNTIVDDIFQGTGKTHKDVLEKIWKTKKPQSFKTQKIVSIGNVTQHHPEGVARNVTGFIEGSDPVLKKEAVMLSAHLDHLGFNHKMMPGANDNASGVAVIMGVAKAIHESGLKPRRSIIFNFFGAEEQGVKGSEFYLKHPFIPNKNLKGLFNLDGVGRGTKLVALAAKNYPELWKYIDDANQKYIHRVVIPTHFHNRARPRLDAAHFMWAGVPTISFSSTAAKPLGYAYYHRTLDNLDIITPEIMEDLAQLLYIATLKLTEY